MPGATGEGVRHSFVSLLAIAVAAVGSGARSWTEVGEFARQLTPEQLARLGARYRRIAKRRGKQKAIVAVGNSVLVIVYHLLGDPEARFGDLGAEHYDARINKQRRARNLAAQLQALIGQRIMIRGGKAVIVEPEAA